MRFGLQYWLRLTIPLLALAFAGCGVTDGAKGANDQNIKAGEILFKNPDQFVSSMGADVKANAETVAVEIGYPENPEPYSPEASAAARKAAETTLAAREEGKAMLWQIIGAGASLVGLGGCVGWLRSALTAAKLLKYGKVVTSVVEKLPDVKKLVSGKAAEKGVSGLVDGVKDLLSRS